MSLDYNSGRTAGYLERSRFDIPLTEGLKTEAEILERVTLSLWGTGFERRIAFKRTAPSFRKKVDFTQLLFNERINGRYGIAVVIRANTQAITILGPKAGAHQRLA